MLVVDFSTLARDRFEVFPTQLSITNGNDLGRLQQHWICADADRSGTFSMKIASTVWKKAALSALLAGCLLLGSTLPARAGLGANAASVASDASAMQATMTPPVTDALSQPALGAAASSPASSGYAVKSFVTSKGVTVREYLAPSGTVFGVGWQGHRPPNLSVLLGSYYREYSSASATMRHKDLHRARIVAPNSVVVMSGHMGHVTGHAYVPSLVPSGVDAQAVVK